MKYLKLLFSTCITCLLLNHVAQAVPAPFFTIYGLVKDEFGYTVTPSDGTTVSFYLNGVETQTTDVSALYGNGSNYGLRIPMDSGTGDPYSPSAGVYNQPFTIRLVRNNQTLLPIEVNLPGGSWNLGNPGENMLLDLTMGTDSDGDGIPDEWERLHIVNMNSSDAINSIEDVDGTGDFDGDGVSDYDEYLASTYAFERRDKMALELIHYHSAASVAEFEFLVITGKTYKIEATTDLKSGNWQAVDMYQEMNNMDPSVGFNTHYADSVDMLNVYAPSLGDGNATFYRLRVR